MANEEIKRIVMGFRPIDDDFMNIIFSENTPLVEYVLQVILDKSDLVIEEIILPRLTLIRYQAVKLSRSFLILMSFSLPKKMF